MSDFKNEFTWSISRNRVFQACPRQYYFNYYGYWGGWEMDAPARTRQIYILKNLKNRYMWAGEKVHSCIKHTLINLQRGISVLDVSGDKSFKSILKILQIFDIERIVLKDGDKKAENYGDLITNDRIFTFETDLEGAFGFEKFIEAINIIYEKNHDAEKLKKEREINIKKSLPST